MRITILILIILISPNKSFSQLKDTVFGKVKSVREELIFLDINRQNYRLFDTDGDYGHSGFMNNNITKSRFYNNWYNSAFVHYLNYYKEYDLKRKAINEVWLYKNGDTVCEYKYKYNKKDKLVQIKEIHGYDKTTYDVTNFSYNDYKNVLLSKLWYVSDEPEFYTYEYYVYDENNKMTESHWFNSESDKSGRKYVYDGLGRKKKEIIIDYWAHEYNEDGSSLHYSSNINKQKIKEEYFYDDNGNVIEIQQYRNKPEDENQVEFGGKIKRYYSKKGQLEYSITVTKNDTLDNFTIYKYDKKGRKIEQSYIHKRFVEKDDDIIFDKKEFKFDNINLPKRGLVISSQLKYKYDNDNLIELSVTETWGKIKTIICKFEYVFDDKNNWVEQSKIINGEKLYVWKRKITYYE